MKEGRIIKISGPLVVAEGCQEARMFDLVRVSKQRLMGEIIELRHDRASIQVYEETTGIGASEPVYLTGEPLTVELGPGLIGSVFDGIQRPLDVIRRKSGDFISRGLELTGLNRDKKWQFKPRLKAGDGVQTGDVLGEVRESSLITHKILVPVGIKGNIKEIYEGEWTVEETVVKIETERGIVDIKMMQVWPVRKERPVKDKLAPMEPLVTGQRVIDTLFPIAKGGTACIPGPFGSGKTIFLHTAAKWSDAQVVVYVACGERGNEVCDLLLTLPKLKDPKTDRPLMEKTVVIANTSNMPVAAREASVYTGITIAEYFRDMGYSVALMADSTSRWAEALREISGRLEEMPGEEGYPAYLSTRIAEFYERAGRVVCLGGDNREGNLSVIGAVSPPGGDLSDPVVQSTLRVVKVFWGLEDRLANMRHFPAINWLLSYSLYHNNIVEFLKKEIAEDFLELKKEAMRILDEEAQLQEIARLVGVESLSDQDRLTLQTAKSIREDFLHQNAFHPIDTYTSLYKQYLLLKIILLLHNFSKQTLQEGGMSLKEILALSAREKIARAKYILEDNLQEFEKIEEQIHTQCLKSI